MPILESEAIWKQGDFLHLDSDKVQADNDVVYATKYTHICLVCNLIHLEIHLEMAIHVHDPTCKQHKRSNNVFH